MLGEVRMTNIYVIISRSSNVIVRSKGQIFIVGPIKSKVGILVEVCTFLISLGKIM